MKDFNFDRERRKQARLEKLNTNEPRCAVCGNTNWWQIEQHHVAGQARDATVVLVCANCHLTLSEDQKDHPASTGGDPNHERIGHFLLGLADMLRVVVEKLVEFGHFLIGQAQSPAAGGAA